MSLAKERAREELVRHGRNMMESGLVTGTWGNLSARVAEDNVVAITPSGLDYAHLQAKDMVIVDLQGNIQQGERRPSTEMELHLEIYRRREDVCAIVHTHSTYATALAVAGIELPVILEEIAQVVGGPVRVARYALAGSRELAVAAADALGTVNAVMLANHGVVGVGLRLDEALRVCTCVERAAKTYFIASQMGLPRALSEADVQHLRSFFMTAYGQH